MAISLPDLRRELRRCANPERARVSRTFFKTGPGEYAEGDQFIGVAVPEVRRLAKRYAELPLERAYELLASPVHEERLCALFLMIRRFQTGDDATRKAVYEHYLAHTASVNNWDLVDTSAGYIVGGWLDGRSKKPLLALAASPVLWERRIAMIATFPYIRRGEFDTAFQVAERLLGDPHDLLHKAVGWMLREIGKRDKASLEGFLAAHAATMPRTALRYAIERFSPSERRRYMMKGK